MISQIWSQRKSEKENTLKNFQWNRDKDTGEGALRVYLFVSRNKDNKELKESGYRERRRSFLAYDSIDPAALNQRFHEFVLEGVPGEVSRMYRSVNARDPEKVRKALMIELITNDNLHIGRISSITAGIAAQKECAAEKKWLIDFDSQDPDQLHDALEDITKALMDVFRIRARREKEEKSDAELEQEAAEAIAVYPTLHGYAIVTDCGFDSREFVKKWEGVAEIKKDDLLFMTAEQKPRKQEKETMD